MARKGYVQVYTGSGKGKTTASLGLAVRAAGAGMKVLFLQFVKHRGCSEHKALERFSDLITVRQSGTGFIRGAAPSPAARRAAQQGIAMVTESFASSAHDLVILDEINVALHLGVLEPDDVIRLIEKRPPSVELVLTGRHAHERIIAMADLVTEMREVKHYFAAGVKARKGIEC